MASPVRLLTGPARSGKTERLLGRIREQLRLPFRERPAGEIVWIAPTERVCRDVRRQLLSEDLSRATAARVQTFDRFADAILEWSSQNIQPFSAAAQRNLLRNIIADLLASGGLPYFASIAGTTGFLTRVQNFIAELKRDEVWPEEFLARCRSLDDSRPDRDTELGRIYDRYQARLHELDRFDQAGRLWAAREQMRAGYFGPFEQIACVVVDGFADFGRTQTEILRQLALKSDELWITLPTADPEIQPDLAAGPQSQAERLRSLFEQEPGIDVTRCTPRKAQSPREAVIRQLSDSLFAAPHTITPLPHATGVRLWATSGPMREVREVAADVKRKLLAGAHPDGIVVATRDLSRYGALIEDVWTEAGIPHEIGSGSPLANAPLLRSLFAVLRLHAEDWQFDRLMAVLDSSYLNPTWESWKEGEARRTLSRYLRERKLSLGYRVIRERLEFRARPEFPSEEVRERAREALDLVLDLAETLEPLRQAHAFGDWVRVVIKIAEELGIAPESGLDVETLAETDEALEREDDSEPEATDEERDELDRRDERVWRRFLRVLADATEAELSEESEAASLPLSGFFERVGDLLRTQAVPRPESDHAAVRVLDVEQVRGLDIDDLYLIGLDERSFPRAGADEMFYSDAERVRLTEAGVTLAHRGDDHQREMLLFERVLTRPHKRLTLCWPQMDLAGEALYPTPYLRAVQDLFAEGVLPVERFDELRPIPTAENILTSSDLRVVGLDAALHGDPTTLRSMLDADRYRESVYQIFGACEMNSARFQTRGLTPFEGDFRGGFARSLARGRFHSEYQFSVSQLETYANCGFRFLMEYVLKLQPLEDVETATDHLQRGTALHYVLAELFRKVQAEPDKLHDLDWMRHEFVTLLDEQIVRRPKETKLVAALNDIERERLTGWLTEYVEKHSEYVGKYADQWDGPPLPSHFEVGFGKLPEEEGADETERPVVTIGEGEHATFVRGRIDRIDVGSKTDPETNQRHACFNVIDYKTGTPPRFNQEDTQLGRAIQLAVYAHAAKAVGLVEPDATVHQLGYWSLKGEGFQPGLKGSRKWEVALKDDDVIEQLDSMLRVVPRLAERIRSGAFTLFNANEECTQRCAFTEVCRIGQTRSVAESLAKIPEPVVRDDDGGAS